jgi:hypothetical protein
MQFSETADDYETKVRKFAKEHPEANDDDLERLFPKMLNPAAIWAKFNSAGRNGNRANAGVLAKTAG